MFKTLFGFGEKKGLSILPKMASYSVSSLAACLVTLGPPFSSWQKEGLELSDKETELIRPACHCYQLFLYSTYFEDTTLGDVLVGCAIAAAKNQRPELMELVACGLTVIERSFTYAAQSAGIEHALRVMALAWISHISSIDGDNSDDTEREAIALKLCQCFSHSSEQARLVFKPMVESIEIFDIDDIYSLTYRRTAQGLFEDCLQKRDRFKFLYIHKPPPNAKLLYEARKKEQVFANVMESKYADSLKALSNNLKADNATDIIDGVRTWFLESEDICTKLKAVNGPASEVALNSIAENREHYLPKLKALVAEVTNDVESNRLFGSYMAASNDHNEKFAVRIGFKLKHIPDDEIPSFLLTLPLDEFKRLRELQVSRDAFERVLRGKGILGHATADEKAFIEARLSLL